MKCIREFTRLISSISLSDDDKERIADNLIKKTSAKKDFPRKQVAVASAAVIVAAGVCIPVMLRSGNRTRYSINQM